MSLVRVAQTLRPLLHEVVFVGGHLPELLTDEPGTRIRPTTDVDIVVAITTRAQYQRLSNRLKQLGLREDTREGAPICRWITQDQDIVDVMPITEKILSFSNQWYAEAVATATPCMLDVNTTILIPSAATFLATKFDAYASRGNNDLFGSHDLEDIIVVIAGRSSIAEDVAFANPVMRDWLVRQIRTFLAEYSAIDAVIGALPDAQTIPALITRTMERLQRIAALPMAS